MANMDTRRFSALKLAAATLLAVLFCGAVANAQAPAAPAPAAPPPIPRTADGKVDFSGLWVAGGSAPTGAEAVTFAGRNDDFENFENDNGLARMSDRNKPVYKPEFWDRVHSNEVYGNWEDPSFRHCRPEGVPRLGAPAQVIQIKDWIVLFYGGGFFGKNSVRIIPMDGRPHNLARVAMESYLGDAIAKWEGDTLVIETIGFTDESWLHKNGYFHGFNMKVTEKLTRTGTTMRWEATVEDPEFLAEPWTMNPIVRNLNTNPNGYLPEDLPCEERDVEHLVSRARSG